MGLHLLKNEVGESHVLGHFNRNFKWDSRSFITGFSSGAYRGRLFFSLFSHFARSYWK